MKYYFAQFSPVKEGGYAIWFPDVPEAVSYGTDLEEAMFMAQDALKLCLEEYARQKRPFPVPSSLEQAKEKVQANEADLEVEKFGEDFYPLIPAPELDKTPVRLSISMPKNALAALDRKAKAAGMTRSGYISAMALS